MLIILTVSNENGNCRLHRSTEDFRQIQAQGVCNRLQIELADEIYAIENALNNYNTNGAMCSPELSEWLNSRNYGAYTQRHPTKLLFELNIDGDLHNYKFIGRIIDY